MERVAQFFLKRPLVFWSLIVCIIVAGILSYMSMPKLEDPAIKVKQAQVVVVFPGATAHEVEMQVAVPLEDVFRTLPDLDKVRSECYEGMALLTVEWDFNMSADGLEQNFDLLRRKVNDNKNLLPDGCMDPIVIDDMMDVYGIFYALTGEGYTYDELEKYAKYIRRQILTVDGVKSVVISGTRDEVINIDLSAEQLSKNGLLPTQIMMQLQGAGKVQNGGHNTQGDDRLQISVSEAVSTADDVRDLKITTANGKTVRLGDLARVEAGWAEPQTSGFFMNGQNAIAICVAMNETAIVPDVGAAIEQKLESTSENVPVGMELKKVFYQPEKVTKAISSFMINLAESILIVVFILIFTMGLRSGLIIGFGLLLTIACSFPVLLTMDITLQRISLGAFIVTMGMLVDNAIVIMDGILVDKQRGLVPKQYLFRIGKQTAIPLLAATIIAASTFLPIYLSPGTTAEYAGDMFVVLCVSLLLSWMFALVQVPVCARFWMPVREKKAQTTEQYNKRAHRIVRAAITWLIAHKTIGVCGAIIILALSIYGMTRARNVFFPDFDYNQFVVEYFLPRGTSPDKVKADLLAISEEMKDDERITQVAADMNAAPARYCLIRPMTQGGDPYGELMVDCEDFETVKIVSAEWRRKLREEHPDAYIRIRKYNFSVKTTHPIEVRFSGPDPAVLRSLSAQAESIMVASPYVDPYSVKNDWYPQSKRFVANYIQQDAVRSGITRSDVANALQAATDGMPMGILNNNDKQQIVYLRLRDSEGNAPTDLQNVPVWKTANVNFDPQTLEDLTKGVIPSGADDLFQTVPLSSVTEGVNLDWQEPLVVRVNGTRAMEAECDPDYDNPNATVASVEQSIQKQINAIQLPAGYEMKWVGEGELSGEAIGNLLWKAPITLFIVLVLLLLLFNSWKKIFLIICCFPFVICGIVPILLIFDQPFTFMAIVGFMGLLGMMVKNAIVLMDEINRLLREEHATPYDAVVRASVSRVRPVLMASATTVVGMAPLATDPMYGSMAICIMGGLTVGTCIILLLLPLLYATLYHIKAK